MYYISFEGGRAASTRIYLTSGSPRLRLHYAHRVPGASPDREALNHVSSCHIEWNAESNPLKTRMEYILLHYTLS